LEASLSDKSNLNNLVELTKFTKSDNAQVVHASIHALHRVYTQFLMANDLKKPKVVDESSAKTKVQLWLRENYLDYVNFVRSLLSSDEPGLQLPALNILITLIKSESDHAMNNSGAYHFANDVYGPTVRAIINNTNFSEPLRRELIEKYLNVYDDLRHYFFKDAAELIEKAIKEKDEEIMKRSKKAKKTDNTKEDQASKVLSLVATNVYAIVEGIRTMPTDASEIDEFWTVNPTKYEAKKESKKMDDLLGDEGLLSDDDVAEEEEENKSKKKASKTHPLLQLLVHKRGFSSCWLALLKLPMSEEMYKKILLILHKRILPHMSQPKLLMDFLTDSYNIGGSVSLLALNGLFTLIVEHNL
jgi:U3 small nucleolar RNA-associated protein 19